jgi:benzoyl-CoA reductase/2-hydroxyglutaryl-CoA dehydratase subunit BcrC/BadD/HgdB
MDIFHDAATRVKCESILNWKKTGKPVVGYTCSYAPPEIFYAAGILPVRLRGIETDGTDIADAYFGPFICSFPKCILQLAGKGMFDFLDGAVITPGCDSMRRIDECWRKAGEDHDGIVPSFFYYFDVPHKSEAHGMRWFENELKLMIKAVEAHFDVKITHEGILAAIKKFNIGRRMLNEIETMRWAKEVVVSGTDVFTATIAGAVMPRDEYNQHLKQWLSGLRRRKKSLSKDKIRLMLAGSASDEIDLIQLLEKNTDAIVVAENICFGIRSEGNEIDETGDPIENLAKHYMAQSVCPRMFGKYKERLASIKERIDRAAVDGVVMQNIRFCDLHGAENSLYERDLEAAGIPCLKLEREYGPKADSGRMKLRINAFLERIENRMKRADQPKKVPAKPEKAEAVI